MKERATHKVDLDASIRRMDFRSMAIVDVLVGSSGEVVCDKGLIEIPLSGKPVETALRSWKFKPKKQNGRPVAYLGRLEFMLCNVDCGEEAFGVSLLK